MGIQLFLHMNQNTWRIRNDQLSNFIVNEVGFEYLTDASIHAQSFKLANEYVYFYDFFFNLDS